MVTISTRRSFEETKRRLGHHLREDDEVTREGKKILDDQVQRIKMDTAPPSWQGGTLAFVSLTLKDIKDGDQVILSFKLDPEDRAKLADAATVFWVRAKDQLFMTLRQDTG